MGNETDAEILFCKYQPIDRYLIENLSNNQLFFSDPTKFNDPFDCKFDWYRKGTKEEWIAHYMANGWDRSRIETKIEDDLKNGRSVLQEGQITYHIEIDPGAIPYVCCFSKTDDSILMWSHYADYHKGICLRFKSKKNTYVDPKLQQEINNYDLILNSVSIDLRKVEYFNECPEINLLRYDISLTQQVLTALLTKYREWSYEDEYRLLIFKNQFKGKSVKNYEKNDLEGVIFGLRVERNGAQSVYDTVKKHYLDEGINVNFYKAEYIQGRYAIKIEKIEKDIDKYLESLPISLG